MLHESFRLINEEFYAESVLPEQMDSLWAMGWRHFGAHFFRYNVGFLNLDIRFVIPLRIRLADFSYSKSQRRLIRRNGDLDVRIGPARVTDADHKMFHRHKTRFDHSVPESLLNFISSEPDGCPCECRELRVFEREELVAVSYFDVGHSSTSGVYGMFDPARAERGLGMFTLLKEIQFAVETGREFYYLGYSYEGPSFYDYKKRFRAAEAFDWREDWTAFERERATTSF